MKAFANTQLLHDVILINLLHPNKPLKKMHALNVLGDLLKALTRVETTHLNKEAIS